MHPGLHRNISRASVLSQVRCKIAPPQKPGTLTRPWSSVVAKLLSLTVISQLTCLPTLTYTPLSGTRGSFSLSLSRGEPRHQRRQTPKNPPCKVLPTLGPADE